MKIENYSANAGLGIIFPAKTFIIEGEDNIYIISPGPLSDNVVNNLKSINKEKHFIAPNNFHNLYIATVKKEFPDANLYGPKRAMEKSGVELKPISELPDSDIKSYKINGNKSLSEYVFYLIKSKELIITDIIFNMNHQMTLPTKLMFKLVGVYHRIATSKLVLKSIDDKAAFNDSLKELLNLKPQKIYLNHGDELSHEDFEKHIKSLTE